MEIYKQAIMQDIKIQTNKGLLIPQQLFTLGINELDSLAISLQEEYEKSGKKSFLIKRSVKDKIAKLKFDLVLDILQTKQEEHEIAKQKAEDKAHNEKIISLISEKQDESLKGKSIKELEKMLK